MDIPVSFSRTADIIRRRLGRPSDFGGTGSGKVTAWVPVTAPMVAAADVIVCMDRDHAKRIRKRFAGELGETPVYAVGIPDEFEFMDPSLARRLHEIMCALDNRYAPERRRMRRHLDRRARLQAIADRAYERHLALRHDNQSTGEYHRLRFSRFQLLAAADIAPTIYITP